jgi:hypothetical protein
VLVVKSISEDNIVVVLSCIISLSANVLDIELNDGYINDLFAIKSFGIPGQYELFMYVYIELLAGASKDVLNATSSSITQP